jgi:hypothetical protein
MTDTASLLQVPLVRNQYDYAPDLDHAVTLYTGLCSIQPFLGIEDEIDRDTTTSQCRLISDESGFYQATAQHYISLNGQIWKIDGKPFIWRYGGRVHHVELNMRLVEG